MSTAPVSPPSNPVRTGATRPGRPGPSSRPVQAMQPMQAMQPIQVKQPMQPVQPNVSVRRMLRTFERVVLREGGQRGALGNAYAAVLEGEQRAALRADARASLQRLADPTE